MYQQNTCPFPQSTACEISVWLDVVELVLSRADGERRLLSSGSLTARAQPGNGHHWMLGLLSTNACGEKHNIRSATARYKRAIIVQRNAKTKLLMHHINKVKKRNRE